MNNNGMSEEQKVFIDENLKKMKEKELFHKLAEIGPDPDEKEFGGYVKGVAGKNEADIFRQEVSEAELTAANGGRKDGVRIHFAESDPDDNCTRTQWRNIYRDSFPNCAATVEADSWCDVNDACYFLAIIYQEMEECSRAWR